MNEVEEDTPSMQAEQFGACFLDQHRVCSADCMAFLAVVPSGDAYIGEMWAHCHLLVQAERTGRHLPIIALGVSQLAKLKQVAQAEHIRRQPPPSVGG